MFKILGSLIIYNFCLFDLLCRYRIYIELSIFEVADAQSISANSSTMFIFKRSWTLSPSTIFVLFSTLERSKSNFILGDFEKKKINTYNKM